ncbi:hypothetical protein QZH41_009294 [Actinostola sp. cb2023]|nr:hypothetical protein QZH41_009294 [Actinostola sp. cb2023]
MTHSQTTSSGVMKSEDEDGQSPLKRRYNGTDPSSDMSDGCSSQCYNGCCRPHSQPCKNGGTCIELCQNVTRKFECKCRKGFTGRVCGIPVSCAAYSSQFVPHTYTIRTANDSRLKVFCDAKSEPGIVWTLIESFALSQRDKYQDKDFAEDFPVNTENLNWTDYRLSRFAMGHVKTHSTHWRATCNYNSEGLVKRDYIRGLLSDVDIIMVSGIMCVPVSYINIRGIHCSNCTTHIRQGANFHVFVDSNGGSTHHCDINFKQGGNRYSGSFCDNFGNYKVINPAHRCTAFPNSTTQWWLGTVV